MSLTDHTVRKSNTCVMRIYLFCIQGSTAQNVSTFLQKCQSASQYYFSACIFKSCFSITCVCFKGVAKGQVYNFCLICSRFCFACIRSGCNFLCFRRYFLVLKWIDVAFVDSGRFFLKLARMLDINLDKYLTPSKSYLQVNHI